MNGNFVKQQMKQNRAIAMIFMNKNDLKEKIENVCKRWKKKNCMKNQRENTHQNYIYQFNISNISANVGESVRTNYIYFVRIDLVNFD